MDKMKMESQNMTEQNVEKIAALFPNCITETKDEHGKPKKAVNFELLRQMLSDKVIDGDEAYELTWVGKKASIAEANKPIRKTLRPCKEESVNWDSTENLYIEGENLEVLKLMQESYLGRVKMIYIDPPYNTGGDFIYRDDFKQTVSEFEEESGEFDEEGNKLFKNNDSNGRFHSDWCSMIYTRLLIARNFLTDDGAIFISIDDHEQDNLKKVCDEIFGEKNFVACVVWQRTYAPISLKKFFSESHEYCLVYARNIATFSMNLLPRSEKQNKDYKNPDNDPRGVWKVGNLTVGPAVEKQVYLIVGPTGKTFMPPNGYCWRFTKEKFEQMRADNRIWFGADGNNSPVPKLFLTEVQDGVTPMTLWTFEEAGHGQEATRELRSLMDDTAVFTSPKPVRYMKRFIQIGMNKDDIIMDFFSGSATTAHTVMELNAEDNGSRKFVLVQLPEECDEKSEAYKAGYKTICDIGKDRIKRAAKKIIEEHPDATFDYGYRVLKLDESNMKDVYYSADEYDQGMLKGLESNIKDDRTDLDLLFGCLLEWGLPLSLPYTSEQIDGCTVHTYNGGDLIACFNQNVPESVIKIIAKRQPLRVVFRDSSFMNSPAKINIGEIFKLMAPDTRIKVI
jgi:adenine-specific DNA-methyltransferase